MLLCLGEPMEASWTGEPLLVLFGPRLSAPKLLRRARGTSQATPTGCRPRERNCAEIATLIYLQLATTYHHIVPGRDKKLCTIYCDSKAALQRVSDLSYDGFGTTWRCGANYDLEAAIKACLGQLNMQISWVWVKGHARRRKKPSEFT